MKKQLLVVLLGTALAAPMAAYAEGAYVGVNVGRSDQKLSVDGIGSISDSGTGYKVYGGYGFNKNFGLEAGYNKLGTGKASYVDGANSGSISSKPSAFYLAVTGTLPVNEQFSLFAKVGASFNRTKVYAEENGVSESAKENHTSTLLGLGASYNFTKNVSVVAEYEDFGKIVKVDGLHLKANLLSIGVRYKF
ncbi:outer membrane beta-barrel protein [Herminiimonas glaciei]|uniref:Outer membrane beta-barrel protein n=1 Tax=Herminiimonas glaciei TaxID=523788 RepID=A0ABW2IDB2_9BURK